MFKKKNEETDALEAAIANLHFQMSHIPGNTPEYSAMADNLTKLYKLREHNTKPRVKPDTVLLVAGNLAGIAMIIGYEKANVITSKALGFVMKTK